MTGIFLRTFLSWSPKVQGLRELQTVTGVWGFSFALVGKQIPGAVLQSWARVCWAQFTWQVARKCRFLTTHHRSQTLMAVYPAGTPTLFPYWQRPDLLWVFTVLWVQGIWHFPGSRGWMWICFSQSRKFYFPGQRLVSGMRPSPGQRVLRRGVYWGASGKGLPP